MCAHESYQPSCADCHRDGDEEGAWSALKARLAAVEAGWDEKWMRVQSDLQDAEQRAERAEAESKTAGAQARMWREAAERAKAQVERLTKLAEEYRASRDERAEAALRADAALARAREVLREVEWEGHHMGRPCCPVCGGLVVYTLPFSHTFTLKDDFFGHRDDCALKAALED